MRIGLGGNITVTATDRWLTELRLGHCFTAGRRTIPAAGQRAHFQLFNPVGSLKLVLVRKLLTGLSGTDQIYLRGHTTPLASLWGTGNNLLFGGANAVCHTRYESAVGYLGDTQFNHWPAQGLSLIDALPEWGVELGAGEGLTIGTEAPDTVLYGNWWWMEV